MAALKKSLIDDNYQRAQDIVSLPSNSGVKPGHRLFRRDFTPEEREKILRRVSQVGVKRAADEYGASINVVKEWLKGIDMAMEETTQPKTKMTKDKPAKEAKGIKTLATAKKVFTPEERAAIVKRADEIGLHEAASEYKVSWQAINAWRHSRTTVQETQAVSEITVKETSKNLELENQLLMRKIELLTKEFNRLKKAVTDLTELIE